MGKNGRYNRKKIVRKLFGSLKDFGAIFFVVIFLPYMIYICIYGIKNPVSFFTTEKKTNNDTYVIVEGKIGKEKIPLEEYLIGALAASIDIQYQDEVLKAQAVLLRTELEYQKQEKKNGKWTNSDTQYISNASLAYLGIYDMQQQYGKEFSSTYERLKTIVNETEHIYLVSNGVPIEGAFCAVSAGSTRSGNEVFETKQYPYLQPVICENDVMDKNYCKDYYFTWDEIEKKMEEYEENADEQDTAENRTESKQQSIEITKTDSTGYAVQVQVGNTRVPGEMFRELFRLNSSHMELEELEDGIRIRTKGIGHGFGMSQHMAQCLAEKDYDFIEILSFFFADTEIEKE